MLRLAHRIAPACYVLAGRPQAAAYIGLMACGLPTWERRVFCMLQANVDESENHVLKTFVLGGFVADETQWRSFSAKWSEALLTYNNGRRFKMAEVAGRWSEERQREVLPIFAKIIWDHVQLGFSIQLNPRALKEVYADHPEPGFRDPWHFSLFMLVVSLATSEKLSGKKMEYVFDTGRAEKKVRKAWPSFMSGAPPIARECVVGEPQFRDDEKWLPLQAADFRAWWVRRRLEEQIYDLPKRQAPEPFRSEPLSVINRVYLPDDLARHRARQDAALAARYMPQIIPVGGGMVSLAFGHNVVGTGMIATSPAADGLGEPPPSTAEL